MRLGVPRCGLPLLGLLALVAVACAGGGPDGGRDSGADGGADSSTVARLRELHVCLAYDITNSWSRPNYYSAREAAVVLLDDLGGSAGADDQLGMAVFGGRYAWEYTPLTRLSDTDARNSVRESWAVLETASRAGEWTDTNGKYCDVYTAGFYSERHDDYSYPPPDGGGCFPGMPREYADEPGTDHTTGVALCGTMLSEVHTAGDLRALVMLTDGYANGTTSGHGSTRTEQGYVEERWREYQAEVPHSTADIETESVALIQSLHADIGLDSWVVSFVADPAFLAEMPTGGGTYSNVFEADDLVETVSSIAADIRTAAGRKWPRRRGEGRLTTP